MKEKKNIFLPRDHLFLLGWYVFLIVAVCCILCFSSGSFEDIPDFTFFIYPYYWKALLLYFYGVYGLGGFFIGHILIVALLSVSLWCGQNVSRGFYIHGFCIPLLSSVFGYLQNKGFYACGMLGEIVGGILDSYWPSSARLYFFAIVVFYILCSVGLRRSAYFLINLFSWLFSIMFLNPISFIKCWFFDWLFIFFPPIKKYFLSCSEKNRVEEALYRSIYEDFYYSAEIYGITFKKDFFSDVVAQTIPLYQRFEGLAEKTKDHVLEIVSTEEQHFIFDVLRHFGIEGTFVASFVGPAVKTIVFTPSLDTKLQKIFLHLKDIGRAIGHPQLRMQYPLKTFPFSVALEYPKEKKQVLDFFSYAFDPLLLESSDPLLVLLGLMTDGSPFFLNIKKAPHVLLAGTTGSGKSSLLHVLIVNILWRQVPSAVQLVLIDPKKTEFELYQEIPHLLFPIASDFEKIQDAIDSLQKIMNERYELFQSKKCKNIDEYNQLYPRLSLIFVIIDEYADLVMQSKQIETKILRILQLSRAAGIHVVVATQRPSADILNTTLKSNLPVRIACKVASSVDSRIILDTDGADQLLGYGDMIIFENGSYVRVHGFFIDDARLRMILQ